MNLCYFSYTCQKTLLLQTYFISSAWIDKKRKKINYKQRMGLYRTQTTNNDDEDEREFTPALNILSQMIAITTFLCFYISTLLTLKVSKFISLLYLKMLWSFPIIKYSMIYQFLNKYVQYLNDSIQNSNQNDIWLCTFLLIIESHYAWVLRCTTFCYIFCLRCYSRLKT